PNADHAEPFQRAMPLTATPPAVANLPPATRSPLGSVVSAKTNELASPSPVPSADHCPVAGSNAAILFAATFPATVNWPAITRWPDIWPGPAGAQIVIADTVPFVPGTPSPSFQS